MPSIIGGIGMGAVLYISMRVWPYSKGWRDGLIGLLVYLIASQVIRLIVGPTNISYSVIGLGVALLLLAGEFAWRRMRPRGLE